MSEGLFSAMLCIHIVGIETFDLYGLRLCAFEEDLSLQLYIHRMNIDVVCSPYYVLLPYMLLNEIRHKVYKKLSVPKIKICLVFSGCVQCIIDVSLLWVRHQVKIYLSI